MVEVINNIFNEIGSIYDGFLQTLPLWAQTFVNLFLLVVVVLVYSIFIWKFYRFISTKNIFGLDLHKYNKSNHPFGTKVLAASLYFLEYIIILPFIIFFWFAIFTLFFIILTGDLDIQKILVISAIVISAIRMASYYKEDLSKDLAKLLPFTLLSIAILTPGFFNFERIISNFTEIPTLLDNVLLYLIFIIILEIVLRFFDFLFSLFGLEEEDETAEENNKKKKV